MGEEKELKKGEREGPMKVKERKGRGWRGACEEGRGRSC